MKNKLLILFLIINLTIMLLLLIGCGSIETNKEKNGENIKKENQDSNIQKEVQNKSEKVVGNGGAFVKYEGYIYYWKIDANSREKTALFANFNDTLNYKNQLMKMDENGNEELILKTKGSGDIFILNNKLFLSYSMDEYGSNRKIFSIDLEGKNLKEHSQGIMKCIVGDYIICQTKYDGDIYTINSKTEEIKTLKKKANILGCIDETVYYSEMYNYDKSVLNIGSIKENIDNGIIASISISDFENYNEKDTIPIEIIQLWKEDEKINIYAGYYAGTAHILQEAIFLTIAKDGSVIKKQKYIEADTTSIESEKKSESIYLKSVEKNGDYFNNLVYVDKGEKQTKEIMTEEEINEKFNFVHDDEHITVLYNSNMVGDDAYIVLDYGQHYSAEDIGWRYAYKRLKTICFKYNIKTNQITKIYEF